MRKASPPTSRAPRIRKRTSRLARYSPFSRRRRSPGGMPAAAAKSSRERRRSLRRRRTCRPTSWTGRSWRSETAVCRAWGLCRETIESWAEYTDRGGAGQRPGSPAAERREGSGGARTVGRSRVPAGVGVRGRGPPLRDRRALRGCWEVGARLRTPGAGTEVASQNWRSALREVPPRRPPAPDADASCCVARGARERTTKGCGRSSVRGCRFRSRPSCSPSRAPRSRCRRRLR